MAKKHLAKRVIAALVIAVAHHQGLEGVDLLAVHTHHRKVVGRAI